MEPSIVIVGSCNMDLISYTETLPHPGETILGNLFQMGFGGKGANQCIAAARLGASTAMVGRVGDDTFGENYLKNLKDNNINIEHVKTIRNTSTGVATIVVDGKGENCIIVVGGANYKLTTKGVMDAEKLIRKAKIVVCQGELDEQVTKHALTIARKHKVLTLMNAAPASPNMDQEIYSLSDIFCVNESEIGILTGKTVSNVIEAEEACNILMEKGCSDVIVTLGAEGAFSKAVDGTRVHVRPPSKVTVVDTTGAGDMFVGALAYFLAIKPEIGREEILRRSCKMASISVQAKGTQLSFPFKEDLKEEDL